MGQYRKKPVEVEARQIPDFPKGPTPVDSYEGSIAQFLDQCIQLASWCNGISHMMLAEGERTNPLGYGVPGPHIVIPTLEGILTARSGDWIIKGVAGEFYPVKNNIFEATYEEVFITKTGKVLTQEEIARLSEEAEGGYDIEVLKQQENRVLSAHLEDEPLVEGEEKFGTKPGWL